MPTSNTTLITPNAEPKIIQPEQLKLGKYKRYRPAQEECIGKLLQSEAKIQLVQAPTGSGKSLLAAAYHKHLSADTRMVYTCHSSRGLGTVSPPIRWNCPAELPIIELRPV
jgi:CRISPR/Cas system-associated endonuclease/helicase Cas3